MTDKRILSGVIAGIALIGVALAVYFLVLQPNANTDDDNLTQTQTDSNSNEISGSAIAHVNGVAIGNNRVGAAYDAIIENYRVLFSEGDRDFDEFLQGASGSYFQLQLAYLATSQVINELLILEEADRQNLSPANEAVEEAAQRRLDDMLIPNGTNQDELRKLFEDPEERALTKQLLGIPDDSVDALVARLISEEEARMKTQLALMSILGHENFETPEANEALQVWIDQAKEDAEIVFDDALLAAYHLEALANASIDPVVKRALLEDAIVAYENVQENNLSEDPNIGFYLAQLYNLSAQVSADVQEDFINDAQENIDSARAEELAQDSQSSLDRARETVQQSFQAVDGQNDRDFEALIQTNPDNPVSYVQYARFLMTDVDRRENDIRRHLEKAIQLDENYIDAYVITADVDVRSEFYSNAIKNLSKAYDLSQNLAIEDMRTVLLMHSVSDIKYKLADANILRAEQVIEFPTGIENPDQVIIDAITSAELLLSELLTELANPSRDYAFALVSLGDVNMIKEDFEASEEFYLQALEMRSDVDIQTKLAQAYIKNEKLDDALILMEAVVEEYKGYGLGHWTLGEIYQEKGELDKAMISFKNGFNMGTEFDYEDRRQIAMQAIDMDGSDVEMRKLLATHYLEGHRYSGAEKQYVEILALEPSSSFANLGLGQILMDNLKYVEASDLFMNAAGNAGPIDEKIQILENVYRAERFVAGPGNLMRERGQEILLALAELYLEVRRLDQMDRALDMLRNQYPDYSPEMVSKLSDQLSQVVVDSLPGFPRVGQGRRIIVPGESHPEYNSVPPTSGWHYSIPATWGIHESQIEDEVQLRNLSAGAVLIQYNPDLGDETIAEMVEMVESLRENSTYCRLILAPYEGLGQNISLTAWERIDELDQLNWDRIRTFMDTFIERVGPAITEVSCTL
jgi:hypothetical protein